jgi:coenzyme F420-dependent glucose-6-phosphate dehydrogenase
MLKIGYQASHEQFSPSELLSLVTLAEECGFDSINSSDHFFPWSERQGQSGFAFAWLGAAMQATSLPFGSVCAPGQRYHPAIVAQAIATLANMFPSRFWIALGSGEALNEAITGEVWPDKATRNKRLLECATIIRKMLKGETVTHHGLVNVSNAKLYTLPSQLPLLIGAAISVETAAWMGGWADGLITVSKPHEELKAVVEAFRQNGGEGKPVYLKVQLSYAHSEEEALMGAYDQWRNNIFQGSVLGDLRTVEEFDAIGELVKPADLIGKVRISSSLAQHTEWLMEDLTLGFDQVILHQVNKEQALFIKDFGHGVLPQLKLSRRER